MQIQGGTSSRTRDVRRRQRLLSLTIRINVLEAVHIGTGKSYAAKVISKRLMAGREHMVRNEIAILRKLSMGHESILTLVDYFETVNSRTSSHIKTKYSLPYYRSLSWRGAV